MSWYGSLTARSMSVEGASLPVAADGGRQDGCCEGMPNLMCQLGVIGCQRSFLSCVLTHSLSTSTYVGCVCWLKAILYILAPQSMFWRVRFGAEVCCNLQDTRSNLISVATLVFPPLLAACETSSADELTLREFMASSVGGGSGLRVCMY